MPAMRHLISGLRRWAIVLALPAAACTGAQSPSPAARSTQAPAVPWLRMTPEQKYEYMRTTVMPEMKALFMRFDPHRYAAMGCVPCHTRGPGPPDYKMPNIDLPLDPSTCEPGPGADPSMVAMNRFMTDQVGPKMGELLGKEFNSCYWCHVNEP